MPLQTQGKIVRVLQEQSFQRVGGTQRVEVDVRVTASSNRDRVQAMGPGRFSEALYYRLNEVPLVVTPLRHRREDMPLLSTPTLKVPEAVTGLPWSELGEQAPQALPG